MRSLLLFLLLSLVLLCGCPVDDDDDVTDDDDATDDDDDDDATDDDDAVDPVDNDGDGFLSDVDCEDDNAAVHPGAIEQCGSASDEDCDPTTNCDDTCLAEFDYSFCGFPLPSPPTPVLHWDYDTNIGATSITGVSPEAVVGNITQGTPIYGPGFFGDAVTLDGATRYNTPTIVNFEPTEFTFLTWMRVDPAANAPGPAYPMANGWGAGQGAAITLAGDLTGGLIEAALPAPQGHNLPEGQQLCANGWAQVALTFDNGTTTLFFDGAWTQYLYTVFSEVNFEGTGFAVGGVGVGTEALSFPFVGELDETMVFDVALTGQDISVNQIDMLCDR